MQAHVPEGLLRQPAGAGEVQLHAQAVGRFRRPAEDVRQLLLAQPGGPALLPGGGAGGDQPRTGDVPHPQAVDEPQGFGIVPVQAAQGRVHRHDQPRRRGIADALHRVVEALRPHQGVVDVPPGVVQRHLHAVQAGLRQTAAQLRRQQAAVGVQPGDEPLGRLHQLRQVRPQGGLPAGEGHLGDVGPAQLL